jgi:3-dehydroquinate synthase
MVGDLAGFAASTFLRGLSLVHVPTSLVAMVDASIGGKTAVNHPKAKNIIGTFYQPQFVLADVQTLTTLSQRELISGWAEVIKHGLILDFEFFEFVEKEAGQLAGLEPATAVRAIGRSAAIKAMIVSEDEREAGRRTLLNYGHTIAHGLEAATNYVRLLHGEAVAIGMMGAAMLSHKMGLLKLDDIERQRELLERFGLPTSCSGIDIQAILRAMELDKKVRAKSIRWVLLGGIGNAVIREDVPTDSAVEVLERLISD